ncbi:MAG: FkbM family methyltransferase [Methylocystis sp.]|jgi:FkbM family methyltransferase|uniref:FkbM family methyltransferase n=1 Tax=Methylocystis sp. TaxID=1911079 RepID=UPI003DA4ECFA
MMLRKLKASIKALLRKSPYKIIRAVDYNRFEAIEETLRALKRRGYAPKVIADGGANVGSFSLLADEIFGPNVKIHMFDPQPACAPALEALAAKRGFLYHAAAMSAKSDENVHFVVDPVAVTTGAYVEEFATPSSVSVPTIALDDVFTNWLRKDDRALLKLDLQGWELEALKGGRGSLRNIEVVLIEVAFYAKSHEPTIAQLVQFFDDAGFELYDIASIYPRPRDNRPRHGDFVFVRSSSALCEDKAWA